MRKESRVGSSVLNQICITEIEPCLKTKEAVLVKTASLKLKSFLVLKGFGMPAWSWFQEDIRSPTQYEQGRGYQDTWGHRYFKRASDRLRASSMIFCALPSASSSIFFADCSPVFLVLSANFFLAAFWMGFFAEASI